jgi:hypothetical protein
LSRQASWRRNHPYVADKVSIKNSSAEFPKTVRTLDSHCGRRQFSRRGGDASCGEIAMNVSRVVCRLAVKGLEDEMRVGQRSLQELIDAKTKLYAFKSFYKKG